MQISIIAVGKKMPDWVDEGCREYTKRFPREIQMNWIEIPSQKRTKGSNIDKLLEEEGKAILAATGKDDHLIALERTGKIFDTKALSQYLKSWLNVGENISFLIGGPEGLSPECLKKSNEQWSLSALTLPHPLVRVILIEQIYRAWSILSHHPYHR